jgi:hypothetical protein
MEQTMIESDQVPQKSDDQQQQLPQKATAATAPGAESMHRGVGGGSPGGGRPGEDYENLEADRRRPR